MKNVVLSVVCLATLLAFATAEPGHAQATRTWVSGVGDDANPCSRTAPCKTFAGAISKTAARGEINVLDPGGFGGVTITKSITISSEGFEAGVLVSGTNAIVINALATDVVVLRGLDFEGLGTGIVGIRVIGGLAQLHIENCTINNFRGTNGSGIDVAPTNGTMHLFIKDTIVRRNGQGTGGGILIRPGVSANVRGSLDDVRLEGNIFGLKAQDRTTLSINDSVSSGNSFAGITGVGVAGGLVDLMVNDVLVSNNGTDGVAAGNGAIVRISDVTITGNNSGLTTVGSGQILSAGNNFNEGNAVVTVPTNTPGQQ